MKPYLCFVLIVLSIHTAQASHLLGGSVQAKAVSGLTYEFTAVVYMHAGDAASQIASVSVCLGNGNTATAARLSYQILTSDRSISVSTYRLVYTYAGPGVYTVAVSLPGRTAAKNSSSANNQAFVLTTSFSTNTATPNQTPTPNFPDSGFQASIGKRLILPLKAIDSEGDSLVYGLARPYTGTDTDPCRFQAVTGYTFPNDLTRQGTFTLDNRTGELIWNAPAEIGTYSIVLIIFEYRNGVVISQTAQEINVIVDSKAGLSTTIPAYVPAIEGTVITATEPVADTDLGLTVFPNPADDQLRVIIRNSIPAPATIQLLALNGQKLHESVLANTVRQHEYVINLNELVPGVYLLSVNTGGRSLLRRLVKK